MAESAQIKTVSVKHEAIIDHMIAYPAMKMQERARHFDVTAAWLSVIINSDVFQIKLKEKSEEAFAMTVVPLREQVLGVARIGVEKLGEALENSSPVTDKDFIADTTDSILKNLGYSSKAAAPATPATVVNNIAVVDRDTLAEAREKMRAIPQPPAPPLEHKEVSVDESPVPPTKEL